MASPNELAKSSDGHPQNPYGRILPELVCAAISFAILVAPSIPPLRQIESVNPRVKAYYFINYFDLGFIKRGLIGTFYNATSINSIASPAVVVIATHILMSAILALSFWSLARRSFEDWPLKSKLPFYALITLSPGLFFRVGFDTGRVDIWCLNLSIITLLALISNKIGYRQKSLLVSASISVQLLIHDASILFYSPLLFFFFIRALPNLTRLQKFYAIIPSIIVPGFISVMLLLYGKFEGGQAMLDEYLGSLNSELFGSLPLELTNSMSTNLSMGLPNISPGIYFGGKVMIFLYFIIFTSFVYIVSKQPWWLCLCTLSPFLVTILATDPIRFMGTSLTATTLLFLISARNSRPRLSVYMQIGLLCIAGFYFVFGPWGIIGEDPLPFTRYMPWKGF